MVFRRTVRRARSTRRRPFRRVRRSRVARRNGPRAFGRIALNIPTNRLVKMRYCESIIIVGDTATVVAFLFSANSIFNPNKGVGGHQAMGHDQWALFFSRYMVVGSKITLRMSSNVVSTGLTPMQVGVYLDDDNTAASTTNPDTIREQGRGRFMLVPNTQENPLFLQLRFSAKKFFRGAHPYDVHSAYGAAFSADPLDEAFYRVWMKGDTGTSVAIQVTIDYTLLVGGPLDLPQS